MITYQTQDTIFRFNGRRECSSWLRSVAAAEAKVVRDLAIVFCSDQYLLEVNRKYLSHNYFTDIITFNYNDGDKLSGDLLISIDSVQENARHYGVGFDEELSRVIVHGLLHLIGYDDHSPADKALMRQKENEYLSLRK